MCCFFCCSWWFTSDAEFFTGFYFDCLETIPCFCVFLSLLWDHVTVCVMHHFLLTPITIMFPSRAVIEGLWLRLQGEQVEVCVRRERRRRILQTLVWFTVTLVLALFIPDIGRVISLIGGLAACFIFVFPGNIPNTRQGFRSLFYFNDTIHCLLPISLEFFRFVFNASQAVRDGQPICKVRRCLF